MRRIKIESHSGPVPQTHISGSALSVSVSHVKIAVCLYFHTSSVSVRDVFCMSIHA